LTVLFIGIDLLLLLSEVVVGLYGGVPEDVEVFSAIFGGPYSFVFWLGQVGLAGVFPMVILAVASASWPTLPLGQAVPPRRPPVGLTRGALAIGAMVVAGDGLLLASGQATRLVGSAELAPSLLPTVAFWLAQLLLGSSVVALVVPHWGTPRFWLAAAGASTVAGILAVRLNIVIPGFVVPVIEHLEQAYQDSRLLYTYFPSGIEWASTVGLVAFILLLFSLASETLPIYETEEANR